MSQNWLFMFQAIYLFITFLVCLKVIYDTRSSTKTLAYLLLIVFLPVIGIVIYFSVGVNYRKNQLYSKKIIRDERLMSEINEKIANYSNQILLNGTDAAKQFRKIVNLLTKEESSPICRGNAVKLLTNGEEKFKEVLEALRLAKHNIHIEYYIYEDDTIGNEIASILEEKAKEGVEIRFIYDDFGSRTLRKKLVPRLQAAGVEIFPFYKIVIHALANRMNYRNHRKIIVIDGKTAFTGGINVSDRYINSPNNKETTYWRDTHLRIDGPAVFYLQYLFITDWNFCSGHQLNPTPTYFPRDYIMESNTMVQIAASGPDSKKPSILLILLQAIGSAIKEIFITTPYFIPDEGLLDALIAASLGGVDVKLLVPETSDSTFVDWAAKSYFADLLNAGVTIYLYQKGFVHAKTLVIDEELSMIGTANMDYRSFELNFEVNALVYDSVFAGRLRQTFIDDLKVSRVLDQDSWGKRPLMRQLPERIARLFSPLL